MSPHHHEQLTDCISAKQLLQALTTLQNINTSTMNELQLSFSQSSHSFFNTANATAVQEGYNYNGNNCEYAASGSGNCGDSQMNFALYMELKNRSGMKKDKKCKENKENINTKSKNIVHKKDHPVQKQNIHVQSKDNIKGKSIDNKPSMIPLLPTSTPKPVQSSRKSHSNILLSPLPQSRTSKLTSSKHNQSVFNCNESKNNNNNNINIHQLKSRSHSPVNNNNRSVNRNSIGNNGGISTALRSVNVFDSLYNQRKNKDNKQNVHSSIQQDNNVGASSIKVSENSKKIMQEREKKGKTYVPIQERTTQLIKQKQEKIAKIQRANLAQKQVQQRQCTFKPIINDYKMTPKIKANPQTANRHRIHTLPDLPNDHQGLSQHENQEILNQSIENPLSAAKTFVHVQSKNKSQVQKVDKNKKNNFIQQRKSQLVLDLIK